MIHRAMRHKRLERNGLAKLLGMNEIMVNKLLSGEVVPSRHLEKKMIELLGIPEPEAHRACVDRERSSKTEMMDEAMPISAA